MPILDTIVTDATSVGLAIAAADSGPSVFLFLRSLNIFYLIVVFLNGLHTEYGRLKVFIEIFGVRSFLYKSQGRYHCETP